MEDIVAQIKRKEWILAVRVMRRIHNRATIRVTKWRLPRNGTRSRRIPITRLKGKIGKSGGKKWPRALQDRNSWKNMGEAYMLQWTQTDEDCVARLELTRLKSAESLPRRTPSARAGTLPLHNAAVSKSFAPYRVNM